MKLSKLAAAVDSEWQLGNLSTAICLFVLDCYLSHLCDHHAQRDDRTRAA